MPTPYAKAQQLSSHGGEQHRDVASTAVPLQQPWPSGGPSHEDEPVHPTPQVAIDDDVHNLFAHLSCGRLSQSAGDDMHDMFSATGVGSLVVVLSKHSVSASL